MKAWIIAGILLFVGGMGLMEYISLSNQQIQLVQSIKAQQKANEADFDNTWKTISQVAGVTEEYKNTFAKVYPEIMAGRYGNQRGGALMSWVTESNPTFDTSLYSKLINVIEGQRATFTSSQKRLIDLKREHDALVSTFPGSLFLAGRTAPEIVVVTSEKTDKAFKTHQDNDVQLFGKQ